MSPPPYFARQPRPAPEVEILGQLVNIRRTRGLRVREVAQRMQCTQGAVSMLETSARRGHSVTIERLLRYATAIGAEIRITPTQQP